MAAIQDSEVGRDNIDPREIFSKVTTDGLFQTCNVTPSGVAISTADRTGCGRIHETCGGGPEKQVFTETTGATEHLREAEKASSPRSQKGWIQNTKTDGGGRQEPQDIASLLLMLGIIAPDGRGHINSRT